MARPRARGGRARGREGGGMGREGQPRRTLVATIEPSAWRVPSTATDRPAVASAMDAEDAPRAAQVVSGVTLTVVVAPSLPTTVKPSAEAVPTVPVAVAGWTSIPVTV